MEGAAKAEEKRLRIAFWQAWHTEAFSRMSGPDFKQSLRNFLNGQLGAERNSAADAVAFFHRMKAAGFPVTIERVVH